MELPPPPTALQPIMTNATTFTSHAVVTRSPWQWHVKTTTTYITTTHQNVTTMTTTTQRQYFLLLVLFFSSFFFFHSFTNVHTELHYHPGQPWRRRPTTTTTKRPPQPNDGQCDEDDNLGGAMTKMGPLVCFSFFLLCLSILTMNFILFRFY